MPKYRTSRLVSLPGYYYAGAEVDYRGWPEDKFGLEPIDDEAKAITAWYSRNKGIPSFPVSPFVNGKLSLPLVGPPLWKLGQSYREKAKTGDEQQQWRAAAIGFSVMGGLRSPHGAFSSDWWPESDVEPLNEQARMVVAAMQRHTGETMPHPAWDSTRQCVNEPIAA